MSEIEKLGKIMLNYLSGIIFIYFFAELDIFSPENYIFFYFLIRCGIIIVFVTILFLYCVLRIPEVYLPPILAFYLLSRTVTAPLN